MNELAETEEVAQKPEIIECKNCGCELEVDQDSIYWNEDLGGDVCDECWRDNVQTCQLCDRDDLMKKDISRYIVLKIELADGPPGIYRVQRYPFMLSSVLGDCSLFHDGVLFVDCLPRSDESFEISGHICRKCAVPYSKTYDRAYHRAVKEERMKRRVYGTKRGYWPLHSAQRIRVNDAFTKHPERLRDYEDDELEDLYEKWTLPKVKTWNEWRFLEHRGVKVYQCYKGDSGWLTLRPEPRYRNPRAWSEDRLKYIFDAGSLPTFDMEAAMKRDRSYDRSGKLEREAVIKAIDQGILTSEGVKR